MRGIYSYADHAERGDLNTNKGKIDDQRNMRYTTTGNQSLRKLFTPRKYNQSGEYWFRIKNVISDQQDLKWQFDYIEFVPLDVVNNPSYAEDWF
jgi:hypothetical protein